MLLPSDLVAAREAREARESPFVSSVYMWLILSFEIFQRYAKEQKRGSERGVRDAMQFKARQDAAACRGVSKCENWGHLSMSCRTARYAACNAKGVIWSET